MGNEVKLQWLCHDSVRIICHIIIPEKLNRLYFQVLDNAREDFSNVSDCADWCGHDVNHSIE